MVLGLSWLRSGQSALISMAFREECLATGCGDRLYTPAFTSNIIR